jgi:hypothetical protein
MPVVFADPIRREFAEGLALAPTLMGRADYMRENSVAVGQDIKDLLIGELL